MVVAKKRYDVEVTGICRICGREDLPTEMHHIISRNQINRANKQDLWHLAPGIIRAGTPLNSTTTEDEIRKYAINNMPGNIVELCGGCHDLTRSSDLWRTNQIKREKRKIRQENNPPKKSRFRGGDWGKNRERVRKKREAARKKKGLFQCEGKIRSGRRCERGVSKEGDYCPGHSSQRGTL